ncbi:MAG: GPW/gp25 family protein [Candidatus Thorarchaeota archaeon]
MRYPHLDFPFHIDADGRSAQSPDLNGHIRDEIIQLLLTDPSERLFLPEFGAGVKLYVFANFDDHQVTMAKTALMQCISRWLGERISLESLEMTLEDGTLNIKIVYKVKESDELKVVTFQRMGD